METIENNQDDQVKLFNEVTNVSKGMIARSHRQNTSPMNLAERCTPMKKKL